MTDNYWRSIMEGTGVRKKFGYKPVEMPDYGPCEHEEILVTPSQCGPLESAFSKLDKRVISICSIVDGIEKLLAPVTIYALQTQPAEEVKPTLATPLLQGMQMLGDDLASLEARLDNLLSRICL